MRTVSADMRAALKSADRRLTVLAEVGWTDGTKYLWAGVGDLSWAGATWRGVGSLASISGLQLTGAVGIQTVELKLSGVPSEEVIDLPLTGVRGRRIRLWLAALTLLETVIPDPYLLASLHVSHASWKFAEDGAVSLVVTTTAGIWQHEQASNRVWSDEEQRRVWPDDSGFSTMTSVAGQTLKWSKT